MKAEMLLKSMIQWDGKTVLFDQKGVPVHDMGSHVQSAAYGYISMLPLVSPG